MLKNNKRYTKNKRSDQRTDKPRISTVHSKCAIIFFVFLSQHTQSMFIIQGQQGRIHHEKRTRGQHHSIPIIRNKNDGKKQRADNRTKIHEFCLEFVRFSEIGDRRNDEENTEWIYCVDEAVFEGAESFGFEEDGCEGREG